MDLISSKALSTLFSLSLIHTGLLHSTKNPEEFHNYFALLIPILKICMNIHCLDYVLNPSSYPIFQQWLCIPDTQNVSFLYLNHCYKGSLYDIRSRLWSRSPWFRRNKSNLPVAKLSGRWLLLIYELPMHLDKDCLSIL